MATESLEALLDRIEGPLCRYEQAMSLRPATTPVGLREHRKALGLTQGAMANAVGLSARHLSNMERGKAPIERRTALSVLSMTLAEPGRGITGY